MLYRIFHSDQPVTGLFLFILTIIAFFISLRSECLFTTELSYLLFDKMSYRITDFVWIKGALLFLVQFINALLINNLCKNFKLMKESGYIPAFIYLLISFAIPPFFTFTPLPFINLILLLTTQHMFNRFNETDADSTIFNLGFFYGILILVAPFTFYYILLILMSLAVLRMISMREWLIAFLGFGLPYFFLFGFYLMTDKTADLIMSRYWSLTFELSKFKQFESAHLTFFILLLFFFTLGILKLTNSIGTRKVQIRKMFSVFFWMTVLAFVTNIITKEWSFSLLQLFSIPFCIIISGYLIELRKNWMKEVSILLLVVGVVIGFIA